MPECVKKMTQPMPTDEAQSVTQRDGTPIVQSHVIELINSIFQSMEKLLIFFKPGESGLEDQTEEIGMKEKLGTKKKICGRAQSSSMFKPNEAFISYAGASMKRHDKKNAMPDDPAKAKYFFSSLPPKAAKLGPNPTKIITKPSKKIDKLMKKKSKKIMSKKNSQILRKKEQILKEDDSNTLKKKFDNAVPLLALLGKKKLTLDVVETAKTLEIGPVFRDNEEDNKKLIDQLLYILWIAFHECMDAIDANDIKFIVVNLGKSIRSILLEIYMLADSVKTEDAIKRAICLSAHANTLIGLIPGVQAGDVNFIPSEKVAKKNETIRWKIGKVIKAIFKKPVAPRSPANISKKCNTDSILNGYATVEGNC